MGIPDVRCSTGALALSGGFERDITWLLSSIPGAYLKGLSEVYVTTSGEMNRQERRKRAIARGRRYALGEVKGFYTHASPSHAAGIVILVDQIFRGMRIGRRFMRRLRISSVLFHEVGHHIHRTIARQHIDAEDAADKWEGKLTRSATYRRFFYLLPLLLPLSLLTRATQYPKKKWKRTQQKDQRAVKSSSTLSVVLIVLLVLSLGGYLLNVFACNTPEEAVSYIVNNVLADLAFALAIPFVFSRKLVTAIIAIVGSVGAIALMLLLEPWTKSTFTIITGLVFLGAALYLMGSSIVFIFRRK